MWFRGLRRVMKTRQTIIGLGLACGIIAGWACLHVYLVFFVAVTPATAPLVIPLVLLQTWLAAGMFIVAHDAMHASLAPGFPRLNAVVGRLALGLYAFFPYAEVMSKHHAHHRQPGNEGDPDFHAGRPTRFWPWYGKFFREYFGFWQGVAIASVVTTYLVVLHARPQNVVLFWACPALLSSLQLFVFGTWLPHRHGMDAFRDRHNARTLDYPWVLSLLTCYHFGYHLEHHRSPGTPWWGLPGVRAARRLQDA
jgi:beta-carotene ketolase (CrtW type)